MAEPQLHDLLHQLLLGPEHHKEVIQGPGELPIFNHPVREIIINRSVVSP